MKTSHPILTTLLAAGLVTIVPALPAASDPTSDPVGETGELHCAFELQPIWEDPDTGMVTADAVLTGCYATFEEAVEAGSGGAVDLAEGAQPADLTQRTLRRSTSPAVAAPGDDVLIGEEFDETGFGPGSALYFAPTGCGQNNYQDPYVGDQWNNRFESGKGFHNCDQNRKFKHQDFGGDDRLCTPNCSDYGSLRNEVSSLKWRNGP